MLAAVAAGLALLPASPTLACSCVQVSPAQARDEHVAVFEGRVLQILAPAPGDPSGRRSVIFEVVQAWKGIESERATVSTAGSSAACGVAFEPETSWLVYADEGPDGLVTGLCSRTRRIEDAEEDLVALGAGVVPVDITEADEVEPPAEREAPARAGCASCAVADRRAPPLAAVLGVGLLVGLVLGRRRRPPTRQLL